MSSDNLDRIMRDLEALLSSEGIKMGLKKRKSRQKRHVERRSGCEEGEYGFRQVMDGMLVDSSQRIVPDLFGDSENLLVAQIGSNPNLLVENWLGLCGAGLDFGLVVRVYLHLCKFEAPEEVYYPLGSYSRIRHQIGHIDDGTSWRGELQTVDLPCTDY